MSRESRMRRVLLVMNQPPGCSGVQGLIYNKILPYLEEFGWEFHFAGPDPVLASVLTETLDYPSERLHYTRNVTPSLTYSMIKHRHSKRSLAFYFYALLQLASRFVERIIRHDGRRYLCQGLRRSVLAADQLWDFDLIGGKSPAFDVLVATSQFARELNKPFLAMIVDPYGKRDIDGFRPYEYDQQLAILRQCCGSMYMSPLTRERYIESGLVDSDKAYFFTDSYPDNRRLYQAGRSALAPVASSSADQPGGRTLRLLHLGMLSEWRPVEALLDALVKLRDECPEQGCRYEIDIYGYLYPEATALIRGNAYLRSIIHVHPMVDYECSHFLAEDADVQLVVIGPRHIDNLPSKFFEYLGHGKPVLVLGPPGNPIADIVEQLSIGVYVNVSDSDAIATGLKRIATHYSLFQSSFRDNSVSLDQYSARQVAKHWCQCLDSMLNYAHCRMAFEA